MASDRWTAADVERLRLAQRRGAPVVPVQQERGVCVHLTLPLFGANQMWQVGGGRIVRTAGYRDWRKRVGEIVLITWPRDVPRPLTGRLGILIAMHEAGTARRDVDGPIKPVLDALQAAGAYENDKQFDDVQSVRMALGVQPRLAVSLWTYNRSE